MFKGDIKCKSCGYAYRVLLLFPIEFDRCPNCGTINDVVKREDDADTNS